MIVTEWLAVYAATLSTLVFGWNLVQSRPRIKVRLVFGHDSVQGCGIYVSAQNRSAHTVRLSNISILYQWKRPTLRERVAHFTRFRRLPYRVGWVFSSISNYGLSDGCPIELHARDAHEVFIPESTLEVIFKEALSRKLVAVVQDKLWINSYSNEIDYPIIPPAHR